MPLWPIRKRGKQSEDGAAPSTDTAEPGAAAVAEDPEPAPAPGGADEPAKRRRRGSRGGRRRAAGAAGEAVAPPEEQAPEVEAKPPRRSRKRAEEEAAAPAEPAPAAEEKPKRRRRKADAAEPGGAGADQEATRRRRKRATPRRSQLPPVRKEMLVSVGAGETRVAVLEEGQVVEVYLERRGRRSVAGNVYTGVVDNVLPGMEASFVDIGLDRNGFLYVDEIVPEGDGKRKSRRIQELVSRGQRVLVQAVKDPMGTKGARLTTDISLPGRFVVYVPYGEGIGISRRLDDAERDRLKAICRGIQLPEGGLIVRTAAEGASEQEIAGDVELLQRLWATIKARAERGSAPELVYREADLPLRLVRDLFIRHFERLAVDHPLTHAKLAGYLARTSPELAARVELDTSGELMERFGVDAALRSTLDRRVDLPSGGYLIFDYAEALTVIDVNTGRFVGPRGRNAVAKLEDTITANNLEAAREIVRQLRLRDIGGIIVIDFIDMENAANRKAVEEALARELERDRTKTYVVEISPLGLVEMTRQNVTDGPREILTHRCPTCRGEGVVVSPESQAVEAERSLRRIAAASAAEALLVEVSPETAARLIGPGGARLAEIERDTGKQLSVEAREGVPPDQVVLLAQGSAAELEPRGLPVAPGDELEVVLTAEPAHDPRDAVARVGDQVVVVAGAAGRAGRRLRVRIERVTRAAAYALVVDAAARIPEAPVEAVSLIDLGEVGAPKRPSRRGTLGGRGRKKAEAEPVPAQDGAPAVGEQPEVEPAAPVPVAARPARPRRKQAPVPAEAVTAEAPAEEAAEEAAEAAPVRRTRRRAVKPSDAGGVETPAPLEPEAAAVAEGERPASEEAAAATDGQTPAGEEAVAVPRRKTRRGSRGGRGRRRKTEASVPLAGAGDGAPVDTPPHDAVARDAGEGDAPPAKPSRRRQARPVAIDGADQAGGSEADPAGDGHDPEIAPATSPSRRRRKATATATAAVEPAPDAEAGAAVAGAEALG